MRGVCQSRLADAASPAPGGTPHPGDLLDLSARTADRLRLDNPELDLGVRSGLLPAASPRPAGRLRLLRADIADQPTRYNVGTFGPHRHRRQPATRFRVAPTRLRLHN